MISTLHIKNIGIIDEIMIDFSKGFNILTGETGAGKTLIIGALGIVAGGRFSKEMIRKGENHSFVEVSIYLPNHPKAVDGNIIISREIFENGKVISFTGNLRTIFEISNQKTCYEYLLDKIIKKEKISENLIKKVHELLTIGTYDERRYILNGERPGEYKKHDYVTGREEVGVSASEVEKEIENLVNEVNSINTNDAEDIIKIATYFHNKFENIHAFADGNGRVGRTLTNYILMINNMPPLIVYDEDKKYYYAALEKYDKEDDIKSMIVFFKYEMEKTWQKTLEKN